VIKLLVIAFEFEMRLANVRRKRQTFFYTGVAAVENINLPNTVTLKPFRTFAEVSQPESEFVLRLKEGNRVGLFEADGGARELNSRYY